MSEETCFPKPRLSDRSLLSLRVPHLFEGPPASLRGAFSEGPRLFETTPPNFSKGIPASPRDCFLRDPLRFWDPHVFPEGPPTSLREISLLLGHPSPHFSGGPPPLRGDPCFSELLSHCSVFLFGPCLFKVSPTFHRSPFPPTFLRCSPCFSVPTSLGDFLLFPSVPQLI